MQFAFNSRMLPLYIKSHLLLDTAQGTLAPIFSSLACSSGNWGRVGQQPLDHEQQLPFLGR